MLATFTVSLQILHFFSHYALHRSVAVSHLREGQSSYAQFFSANNSVFPYARYPYLIRLTPNLYRDLQGNRLRPLCLKNEIFELLNSYLSLNVRGKS
jgi:hypothetical protein